jgi:hypothetical protein
MIKSLVTVLGNASESGCKWLNRTTSSARQIDVVSKQRHPFHKLLFWFFVSSRWRRSVCH